MMNEIIVYIIAFITTLGVSIGTFVFVVCGGVCLGLIGVAIALAIWKREGLFDE